MANTLARIERELGLPGLAALLAERLAPTDLISLLLDVFRRLALHRQPSTVLSDYENNRFVRPSTVSPLRLLEWEQTAFRNLPAEFQPIMLSPVTPLATCSAVALNDQNRVLSTIRNTEVVSDSTNVLALECALRRRAIMAAEPKSPLPVHLAASHRLLRTQRYTSPDLVTHFSMFALCSSGRDRGGFQWELSTLALHIGFYLQAIRAFLGPATPLRIAVTALSTRAQQSALVDQLLAVVQERFADIDCMIDEQRASGRDYYADVCFHIYATTPAGRVLELVDGGAVNWTQKLLGNAKERCVISGIGSERLCTEFDTRASLCSANSQQT